MKILSKKLDRNGAGFIKLKPEELEDLWHIYNLISIGDYVRAATWRKVVNESATGSTSSRRVKLSLKVAVEKSFFSPDGCCVHISGKIADENEFAKKGSYHTLDLDINTDFSIEKDHWDSLDLNRIEESSNPSKKADVAAIAMTLGLAHICLITSYMTLTRARIQMNIPRKRAGSNDHPKAVNKFFESIYRSILEKIDFEIVKCILLGSPSHFNDSFYKFLCLEAIRREDRVLVENKRKFVLCHCTSAHKNAVEEMISQPSIMAKLADSKAVTEAKMLKDFNEMMTLEPDRAFYGFNAVSRACEENAIDCLLVTDSLFKSTDVSTRKKYVTLIEECKEKGAKVYLFSGMHVTGLQLEKITGIAAILRFPLPDVEFEAEQISSSESEVQEHTVNGF